MGVAARRTRLAVAWSRSVEERDAHTRLRLLVVIALTVTAIGLLTVYVFTHRAGLQFEQIATLESYTLLLMLGAFVGLALGPTWAPDMFQAHPILGCMLGGVIWAVHFKVTRADRWLQKQFFSTPHIMKEIGPAQAIDPLRVASLAEGQAALPWREPAIGARLAAWSQLRRFAARYAGTGRSTWFGWPVFTASDRPATHLDFAFRWTVLCGQAGAGKTRMAMEFARLRARSEFFETAPAWRRSAVTIAEWFRRILPWLRRHKDHPWDAGQIESGVGESYLKALSAWRPRRPTLLLLDDPKPGDCLAIIRRLEEGHDQFRFPVRLLIVDQALPAELGFRLVGTKGNWEAAVVKAFDGEIIFLDTRAGLDFGEVSRIAIRLGLPASIWRDAGNPALRQFLQRTRGNALLIELGLHQVLAGATLERIDESVLLGAYVLRIVRIIDAFALGGISQTQHLHALAAATISGPVAGEERAVAREHSRRVHPIHEIFGVLDDQVLERLFNLAREIGPKEIPPVRPEMIGDAFVRFVLEERCKAEGDEARIVEAAWRTNPLGVLRTLSRVAARADKLALELGQAPPPEVEARLDAAQLAFAYATVAVRVPRDLWDAGLAGDSAAMLGIATARIGRLAEAEVDRLLPRLEGLLEPQGALMVLRGWEGLVCIAAAILAADQKPSANPARSKALATAMLAGLRKARGVGFAGFYQAEMVEAAAAAVIVRLHSEAGLSEEEKEPVFSAFIGELGEWTSVAVLSGTAGVTQAEHLRRLAEAFGVSPLKERETYQRELAWAWVNLTLAQANVHDAAGCRASVARVEEIVDHGFAGQSEFEELRAKAQNNLGTLE